MPKAKLFDDESEEEVSLKTENEYAKKYDAWREKEELHKLEQKYGSKALSSDVSASSDSDEESDEPPEVSQEMETQFLKTLALLKTKDPRIYDPKFKAFDEKVEREEEKKPKEKTLTFEDSDSDDDGDGNIFTIEKKAEVRTETEKPAAKGQTAQDKANKGGKLKEYLTGEVDHAGADDEVEKDLAPLRALWSDPKLSEGEAFLRDYILNKRYLEEGDEGEAKEKIRDDEDLEEDEKRVEEQGQFERAYNFRFEEPDQEYLKRYPRTMNYIRPKDDRRARKRAEVRTRKEEQKKRKMEEIARMKALKLKEIQEKIARIKEVTGNEELAFKEEDIEGDFDPEAHDRRMKAIFDEQYYGEADHEKPVFPDLDEELEIENWDNYDPDVERGVAGGGEDADDDAPHCEDHDFNMDADYDPKRARANLLEEVKRNLGKKKRNRKKKSKLARLLATEKPKYVPTVADKTYDQYMEEYYAMDCEDVIAGELPTRFKYRQVVPNDYGLTVEEILLADDKELTQWVPLKKLVKHRPADVEKSEVNTYRQKAADEKLKKKILPSLFKELPEEPEVVVPIEEATKKKKKKKKKNKQEATENEQEDVTINQNGVDDNCKEEANVDDTSEHSSKKKKRKHKEIGEDKSVENDQSNYVSVVQNVDKTTEHFSKKKKKRKHSEVDEIIAQEDTNSDQVHVKKKNRKTSETATSEVDTSEVDDSNKISKKQKSGGISVSLSNEVSVVTNAIEGSIKDNKRKKKHKSGTFVVENADSTGPSNKGHLVGNPENKFTHKGNENTIGSSIHKKNKQNTNPNKKDFKSNFKQNDKFKKNKHDKDKSDNPLSKLSDERLKAYGLNPKKYRSFLKYKKF